MTLNQVIVWLIWSAAIAASAGFGSLYLFRSGTAPDAVAARRVPLQHLVAELRAIADRLKAVPYGAANVYIKD